MPSPPVHFAVGAGTTIVLVNALSFRFRLKRKIVQAGVFVLGGLWALLPDISHLRNIIRRVNNNYLKKMSFIPRFKSPHLTVYTDYTNALHYSHWADIFFFHRLLDEGHASLISAIVLFSIVKTVLPSISPIYIP